MVRWEGRAWLIVPLLTGGGGGGGGGGVIREGRVEEKGRPCIEGLLGRGNGDGNLCVRGGADRLRRSRAVQRAQEEPVVVFMRGSWSGCLGGVVVGRVCVEVLDLSGGTDRRESICT